MISLTHSQESISKEIVLQHDDPAIFELVLNYLYTLDYEDEGLPPCTGGPEDETIRED